MDNDIYALCCPKCGSFNLKQLQYRDKLMRCRAEFECKECGKKFDDSKLTWRPYEF